MKIFKGFMFAAAVLLLAHNSFSETINMKLRYPFSNNKTTNLMYFIGKKPVLAVFFYPKCHPCEKSSKVINKIYAHYQGHLIVVGISLSKDRYDLRDFVDDMKVKYPVYRIDDKDQLKTIGGVFATPTSVIIDKKGIIAEKIIGPRSYNDMIKKIKHYITIK